MSPPVFATHAQISKILGLPRDWIVAETSAGRIPHLVIGGQIYLHQVTVIDCIIDRMKRNVVADSGLMLIEDSSEPQNPMSFPAFVPALRKATAAG
jgi:hypothetical protein